jgi:N-acylneuraminate cytidylyltransferase
LIDRLIVSTDCDKVADIAGDYGVEVPFRRPPSLCGDDVSLIPVMQHAMRHFDDIGWSPDVVVSIQPTCPLTQSSDIDQTIRIIGSSKCDSVVSVSEIIHGHPFRAMCLDEDRISPLTEYTNEEYLQKQDRPKAYYFTGALYARRRYLLESWEGKNFALGQDVRGISIQPESVIDIDHPVDMMMFETMLRYRATQFVIQ